MTDNGHLELNDEHTAGMRKYTAQQLRFIINRLVFPEASSTACAKSAGYSEGANVRASEIGRKPHVRQMLNKCDSITNEFIEGGEMTTERLIAWHVHMVHNPRAAIRERQASAIEVAKLKGNHKAAGGKSESVDIMAEIMAIREREQVAVS